MITITINLDLLQEMKNPNSNIQRSVININQGKVAKVIWTKMENLKVSIILDLA
jgi:hypothetical protein